MKELKSERMNDNGMEFSDGPWAEGWEERSGSTSHLSALLSCPFCGQKAGQVEQKRVFPEMGYRIVCACCNIRINWWHTEEQARTKWNTRAIKNLDRLVG